MLKLLRRLLAFFRPVMPVNEAMLREHYQARCTTVPVPVMVDAALLNAKQEIGIVFQKYPTVIEICTLLPVNYDDAVWLYNACAVADRTAALIHINDLARSILNGESIAQIRRRALRRMLRPAEWQREGSPSDE